MWDLTNSLDCAHLQMNKTFGVLVRECRRGKGVTRYVACRTRPDPRSTPDQVIASQEKGPHAHKVPFRQSVPAIT